jgi:hypothetical protein
MQNSCPSLQEIGLSQNLIKILEKLQVKEKNSTWQAVKIKVGEHEEGEFSGLD